MLPEMMRWLGAISRCPSTLTMKQNDRFESRALVNVQ